MKNFALILAACMALFALSACHTTDTQAISAVGESD